MQMDMRAHDIEYLILKKVEESVVGKGRNEFELQINKK
jgi:hypothetical protein